MAPRTVELGDERAGRADPPDEGVAAEGLPPGPRLPALAQAALLAKRPDAFLETCARRYGRCFTLTAPPLGRAVYVWHPSDVRAIFRGDPDVFRVEQVRKAHALVMGPKSLLLSDGQRHLHDRKVMTSRFHGADLKRYRKLIADIAEREIATWPIGEPFALRPRLHMITLDVIVRVVFGADADDARRARLRDALAELLEINPTLIVSVPAIRRDLGRRSPWGKFIRVRRAVDDFIDDEIRRARRDGATGVLGTLIKAVDENGQPLTDDHVHDQLMTLLIAGQETSASSLAWAFERLTRNPDVLDRLVRSIDAGEDDYLEAVILETLRARPIVAVTPRWLSRESEIAGRRLPAGTVLCIAQWLVQMNPANYDEPERFKPERFLERNPDPISFVAFGGGARRCVGASLAHVEMSTVLRAVLERYELRAVRPQDERISIHHVTFTPARGAEVVATPRQRAAA